MKRTKLIILMMSLIAVFIVSSGAVAVVMTQVWGYSYYAPPDTSQVSYKIPELDLGTLGLWSVQFSGTGALSTTISSATLKGNFIDPSNPGVGHIWAFDYKASISDPWTSLGYAAHTVTAPAGANSNAGGTDGGPVLVTARYLRMGYDWTLSSAVVGNSASVGGTGSMTATSAVPEPGTVLAALSILGPAGILFRRRK